MRGKPLEIQHIHTMWEFYKKNQSTRHVSRECAKVGIEASASTVRKYVNHGDKRRGIVPFKQRLREIQQNTAQVVDKIMVEAAIADIDGWRRLVDRGMTLVAMLMKRAHEKLKPRQTTIKNPDGTLEVVDIPLDAKDLRVAAEAVKVAFGSMKQAAETHDIWSMQSGADADGRDVWLQEHFEEFTPEEHAAFRDEGIWPERIPLPAWMGDEEPQQETDEDPVDVLDSEETE